MNVHEYQAAEILGTYGIPVNPGSVATTPDEAEAIAAELGGTVVVGVCFVVLNLFSDILYRFLDPRST